jgi:PKD repeat protein
MAFEVFVKANQDYWQPSTNFVQGAEGARDAAIDLGYSAQAVKDAFEQVDIFIEIPQGIVAAFTYSAALLTVNFTDTSTCTDCTIDSWDWDFGDGQSSTEQHPTHTYAADGIYTVTLTVTNNNNESDSESKAVTVGEVIEYCESSGSNQNYEWVQEVSLGDFSNASGAGGYSDFTDQIIAVGTDTPYAVTLTPGYASTSYTEYWHMWADLNHDGDFEDVGEVLFEGSGSGAVGGTITVPPDAAEGDTRLRVTMKYGGSASSCGSFTYGEVEDYTLQIGGGPSPPEAAFSYAADGLTVSFTDESTASGGIDSWEWDFGDGVGTSMDQNPTYGYASAGTYTVSLTVTAGGMEDTASADVSVSDALDYCASSGQSQGYEWIAQVDAGGLSHASGPSGYSDFTGQVIAVDPETPYAVTLTPGFAGSSYTEYWRIWADLNHDGDFEDAGEVLFEGSGSGAVSGSITVPADAAEGDTRLRVTLQYGGYPNSCGSFTYGEVEDYTLRISGATPGPQAAFSYAADGLTVSFTDDSTPGGNIVSWDWDFGDLGSSSAQNPEHTYGAAGTYPVSLTVTDNGGLTDTALADVTVSEPMDYCAAQGNNQSYEYVQQVMVDSFSNASGPSGYSDFTGQLIVVGTDTLYQVTLSPGYPGSSYTENWRIWADLNHDGDFEDAGEMLFEGSGSGAVSGSITVPTDAAGGSTRMRVIMKYGGYASSCGSFTYGEVEDYTLSIQ